MSLTSSIGALFASADNVLCAFFKIVLQLVELLLEFVSALFLLPNPTCSHWTVLLLVLVLELNGPV